MNNGNFVYTTYIRSTPEKVWEAITSEEFTRQYWGFALVSEWKKDSKWTMQRPDGSTNVVGKVMEVLPPKKLVYSWAEPELPDDVSQVTFEISTLGDQVKLDVTHTKLSEYMGARVSGGWPLVLSSLKSFLEGGKPIDILWLKDCGKPKAA